jgi:hypothetical protein
MLSDRNQHTITCCDGECCTRVSASSAEPSQFGKAVAIATKATAAASTPNFDL